MRLVRWRIDVTPAAVLTISLMAVLITAGGPAQAQALCDGSEPEGTLTMGVRSDAAPFSFRDEAAGGNDPFQGYSVTLCREFLDGAGYPYCTRPVTPTGRFDDLDQGRIDMLCGATTATLEVKHRYPASLYTFMTATTVLASSKAGRDEETVYGYLRGTTVEDQNAVIGGTRSFIRERLGLDAGQKLKPVATEDHDQALEMLLAEEIALYVADRPILTALAERLEKRLAAQGKTQALAEPPRFAVDAGAIQLQPYAIVFRNFAEGDPLSALPLEFDTYLVRLFGEDRFLNTLIDTFGRDVDVNFARLIPIQAAIPKGRPLGVTAEPKAKAKSKTKAKSGD